MCDFYVNDLFPNWKTGGGIISAISDITGYTPPWNETNDSLLLDIQYHANHSGLKRISPVLSAFSDLVSIPPVLSDTDKMTLASVIKNMYSVKWGKLWDTFSITYNALNNSYVTETTEKTVTDTGTVTNEETINHGEVISTESEVTANQDSLIYGFNSVSPSPSDEQNGSNSGNGTETHSGEDSTDNTRTDDLMHNETVNYERSGSIGVITPQQMIEQERKVWEWSFFETVFADIDSVLTLKIY